MSPVTLICPQCGAPLPRQARWRTVSCTYCGADVVHAEKQVQAAAFHEAWRRAQAHVDGTITCLGQAYRKLGLLGRGHYADVYLADRLGPARERVVIKQSRDEAGAARLRQEFDVLQQLQADAAPGAAYYTLRLPQPVGVGLITGNGGAAAALVLRHPVGYWGSLAQVQQSHVNGIDPRHAVWMWRRVLDVLAYVHATGWCHGRLSPDHLLVQPRDHGILVTGWAEARRQRGGQGADLAQSAWSMRALLVGGDGQEALPASVPAPLAELLRRASEDQRWCASVGAQGLDQGLLAAAQTAFGPPRFIDFSPTAVLSPGKE